MTEEEINNLDMEVAAQTRELSQVALAKGIDFDDAPPPKGKLAGIIAMVKRNNQIITQFLNKRGGSTPRDVLGSDVTIATTV